MANENETQNQNDLLTEEERAALEAEEGAEIDGSASLTGEDTKEWSGNGWGPSDMSAGNDEQAEEGNNGDDSAAATADDTLESAQGDDNAGQDEPAKEERPAPVDLSAFDAKLSELRDKEKELLDQYDDGDLSRDEFVEKRQALADESNKIIEDRAIAKQQVETEERDWQNALKSYRSEYGGLFDKNVVAAFDAEVRAVTSNPILANKSFREQLEIAHKRLLSTASDYGIDNVPSLKGKEPAPKKEDPKPDVRGDDLRKVPPTLARVPSSEVTDEGDSKYAALERVVNSGTPDEIEAALAQLSPEERDRFASAIV